MSILIIYLYLCRANTIIMDSLTIRISRDRIIFASYDRLRNMLPDYVVCPNNPDISLNANVHQAIKGTEMAQQDYNFVDVFTDEPTLLVPLKEFEEDDINDIYFYNFPSLKERSRAYYDTLPYLNAVLLFSADRDMSNTLSDYFPVAKFPSCLTALMRQYVARYPFSATLPRLYCYLCERKLTLVVVQHGALQFANTFNIHNPKDSLYYIAGIAQRFGLSAAGEPVYVSGYGAEAADLADSLGKINLKAFFMDDNEELSHHPIAKIAEFPYDLKVHLLRAYE